MPSAPVNPRASNPLLAGLTAARANLIPGILIQTTMLAMVLAYYFCAPTRQAFDALAGMKSRLGFAFTFVALGVASGVLPELLRIAIFQRGVIRNTNLLDIAFGIPFWGALGCVTDAFYRGQAFWFGAAVTVPVLLKKVAVDMLVFTPLWGTPSVVCGHEWKRSGFSSDITRFFTARFYRETILPVLIANWAVWIPAVIIIYSLPSLLQVPLFALTNCFWALLVTYMAYNKPLKISAP